MSNRSAGEARTPRVALVNLGCRVNRVESDLIAEEFVRRGAEIVAEDSADVVVVNTCAVTGEAEAKARKAIRHAAAMPQGPLVVATGCAASLFLNEFRALGENVVVERTKAKVAEIALAELAKRGQRWVSSHDDSDGAISPYAGSLTPTGRSRPGVKIQDGCDNRCSYCIVWKARGAGRSVDAETVREQVRAEVARGAGEVVLTGINLGRFSSKLPDGTAVELPGLLDWLLKTTDVGRLRLSSIEPPDVTDELLSVMASSGGRVAPFLHVCLQSGCDATLKRMRRPYDAAFFRDVVKHAYASLPEVALGTDLIVGFPGETDEEFEQSLDLCRDARFSRMHVFRYSKRPGTPAAVAPDQVDPHVMAARAERARRLAREMRAEVAARRVGKDELVLVQDGAGGVSGGLYDVELLGGVTAPASTLVPARVESVRNGDVLVARQL